MRLLRAAAFALALAASAAAAAGQDEPPTNLAGWLRRQDSMMAGGQGARAVEEARNRAAREPKNPEALFLLGRVLGNTDKVEEARVQFEGALELDINYAPAWRGMAIVHLRQKDFETALREARKAMDLDPPLESLVLTVHVLYQKGERPAAYRLLQEEMAKRPADNDLRALYASFLMDDQNFRDAEKEFRQVLAADPDNVAARESLLALLVNTGRPDEAVAECREAARRAPKDARIRILLRDLLASRGDYAGAAGAVEEALKLDLTPETRKRVEADLLALREAAAAPKERRALEPDEVLRRLDSPDALQRREAMQMLWEMDLGGLPPAVVRRVTDADETVRLFAVRLLGKYGDARAAGLLEVLLFHPKDHDASSAVRAQAAAALGRIGTPASLPVLFRGLEDADADVLRSSVQGIAGITGKAFVDDVLAPIPEKDRTAVREKYRLWWTSDPTGRLWRRKTCEAVGTSRAQALAWYLLPWIEEEDAALRGEVLAAMAEVTKDEAWRGAKSDTPEERKALVERARAALLGRK